MTAGKTATTFFLLSPGCDSDARMARCCFKQDLHRGPQAVQACRPRTNIEAHTRRAQASSAWTAEPEGPCQTTCIFGPTSATLFGAFFTSASTGDEGCDGAGQVP